MNHLLLNSIKTFECCGTSRLLCFRDTENLMPNCIAPTAWSSSHKPLGIAQCGTAESCQGLRNERHQIPIAGIVIHQLVCRFFTLKNVISSLQQQRGGHLWYTLHPYTLHHGTSQCKLNEAIHIYMITIGLVLRATAFSIFWAF